MVNSECYKKIITMLASVLSLILLCIAMDDNISYDIFGFIVLISILVISICFSFYIIYKKYNRIDTYDDI